VWDIHDHQPLEITNAMDREVPGDNGAPIVSQQQYRLGTRCVDQLSDILHQDFERVIVHRLRSVGFAVATQVGRPHSVA